MHKSGVQCCASYGFRSLYSTDVSLLKKGKNSTITGGLLSLRCADVGIGHGLKWASQWKVAVRTMTGFMDNDLLTAQILLGTNCALRQVALNLMLNFGSFTSFAVCPATADIKRRSRTNK